MTVEKLNVKSDERVQCEGRFYAKGCWLMYDGRARSEIFGPRM